MKTTLYYRFNLQTIKNHIHFLIEKDPFTNVYFIPINNQILFISPCQENIYLTLSDENNETDTIKNYINNTIENDTLNFNDVFSINKKEFGKFLKNANGRDSFYFNITLKDEIISGNCSILKSKKEINEATIPFHGIVEKKDCKNYELKSILQFLLFKNFNFKEIDWNNSIFNLNLRYYGSIYNSLNAYKNELTNIKIFNDEVNKVINVNIYSDDGVNVYSSQILIAHTIQKINENDSNKDILTEVKKFLFKHI